MDGCHERALQLINGKAVMVSELYCDGLGACIGECPAGAIEQEEREAEPYSEEAVMERLAPKGEAIILAHLRHLDEQGEADLLRQGLDYLERQGIELSYRPADKRLACGCPGAMMREIVQPEALQPQASELRQFPVQLHLLNPQAGFLRGAHLLLAADCTAFACGDFHSRFLRGKALAIACPKLDDGISSYVDKLARMIDEAQILSITVLIMEVPCCRGLAGIAEAAAAGAQRQVPVEVAVLRINGSPVGT